MALGTQPPPGWADDELSKYFENVHRNQWATFHQQPSDYASHQRVDVWINRLTSGLINPIHHYSAFLILRAHLLFRTASMLAAAGDFYGSMPVQRSCAETAMYAVVLAKNKDAEQIWIEREDSPESKQKTKNFFAHAKIKSTLRSIDQDLEAVYDTIYQRTIDYGAHPNSSGIFANTVLEECDGNTHVKQVGLHTRGTEFDFGLKSVVQVGVLLIRACDLIWPERVQLLGLSDEMWSLRKTC